MAGCDLCGDKTQAHELEQLLSSYQVDGVVDICPACRHACNKEKVRLLLEIPPAMRDFVRRRRAERRPGGSRPRFSAAAALGWLGRLGG